MRELGLIRKKKLSSSLKLNGNKSKDQVFSYLVIIDFESTCWREKNYKTQEIIEFPAVLLNVKSGQIEAEFHFYVQPQEHPILSEFCKELTGISQKQVEEGIPLRVCLKKFAYWLSNLTKEKKIDFVHTDTELCHKAAFVTWSDWDLSVCLNYECKRKQLLKPAALNSWIDLRATYRSFYQRKPNGLNGALQDLGIQFEGREHSGLHDSRNTARLAWRMMRDGCIMKITKSLNPGNNSIGLLLNPVVTLKQPTKQEALKEHIGEGVTKRQSDNELLGSAVICDQSKKETGGEASLGTETHAEIREERPVKFSKRKSLNDSDLSLLDIDIEAIQSDNSLSPVRATSTPKKSPLRKKQRMYSSPSVRKSPRIEQTKFDPSKIFRDGSAEDGELKCHAPGRSTTKTAIKHVLKSVENFKYNGSNSKTSSPKSKSWPLTSKSPEQKAGKLPNHETHFKKPSPVTNTENFSCKTPNHLHISVVNKTPTNFCNPTSRESYIPNKGQSDYKTPQNQSTRSFSHSTMKCTTPLCKCGRRSKRRMVQSPGPNIGRFFFSCGKGKASNGGCDFFSWDSASNQTSKSIYSVSFSSTANTTKLSAFTPGSSYMKNQQTLSCPFKKTVGTKGKGPTKHISMGLRI